MRMIRPSPRTYNIHEAKTQLSKLLEQVQQGDDVVIARAGVPVARLVAVAPPATARVLGTEAGRVVVAEDFDAPLPADVLTSFAR
jgi:prevent-host-death family protein